MTVQPEIDPSRFSDVRRRIEKSAKIPHKIRVPSRQSAQTEGLTVATHTLQPLRESQEEMLDDDTILRNIAEAVIKQSSKSPSICSIAKELGVAPSTISRALRGDSSVSDETIERVKAHASKLGFRPNTRRSQFFRSVHSVRKTVGYLMSPIVIEYLDRSDLFYYRIMLNVQEALGARKFHMMMLDASKDALSQGGLYSVEEGLVDAVIAKVLDEKVIQSIARSVPCVVLDHRPRTSGVDAVLADVRRAAAQQLDHLHALGHRTVAIHRPCVRKQEGLQRIESTEGFIREVHAYARELDITVCSVSDEQSLMESGHEREAVEVFLNTFYNLPQTEAPTAILIFDVYAAVFVQALEARGLRVPEDISLVGYDDDTHNNPCPVPMTTFRQDYAAMSRAALELLESRALDRNLPSRVLQVEGKLVVRESTARAASKHLSPPQIYQPA